MNDEPTSLPTMGAVGVVGKFPDKHVAEMANAGGGENRAKMKSARTVRKRIIVHLL